MIRVLREAKPTPVWAQERATQAGGRNRFGEPNFRIVWGWSRLAWIGGKWEDRDASGNLLREVVELRQEPKYFPHDRWHVERWLPPEAYGTPERWYWQTLERENGISIPALGPYPARGDWEHSFIIRERDGGFLALTPAVCDLVVRAIEWSRRQPRAGKRAALEARERQQQADYDAYVDAVLWNEPRFHGQPHVTVP